MFTLPLFLVAGGLFTLSMGAPIEQRTVNSYTVYSGDGDISVGWPTQSDWISSFDTMYVDITRPSYLTPTNKPSGSTIKTVF